MVWESLLSYYGFFDLHVLKGNVKKNHTKKPHTKIMVFLPIRTFNIEKGLDEIIQISS